MHRCDICKKRIPKKDGMVLHDGLLFCIPCEDKMIEQLEENSLEHRQAQVDERDFWRLS